MRKTLKTLPVLLLCLLLLAPAAAAAGGADDPLVSLSYLRDSFVPALRQSLSGIARAAAEAKAAERAQQEPAMRMWELADGESLRLGEGQQMLLVSGSAALQVERGTVVNATAGRAATGGNLRSGNRYIVCEDSGAVAAVSGGATVWASANAVKTAAAIRFRDVPEDAWYRDDVYAAVARGLVNGTGPDTYEPYGSLTASMCVKLVACMHQLYREGAVTLASVDGLPWYEPYVDYAREQGLLPEAYEDWNAPLTRRQFVALFYRALPESEYPAVNDVSAVPDMAPGEALYDEVLCFYRAGILSGYSQNPGYAEHAFGPESGITRAEVAAIMSRMFDAQLRLRFTIA